MSSETEGNRFSKIRCFQVGCIDRDLVCSETENIYTWRGIFATGKGSD